METHRRGSDGRRILTVDFEREQIESVLRGTITLSEVRREPSVSPSEVRRWKHLAELGSESAIEANEEVVPAGKLKAANERIRELGARSGQEGHGGGNPPSRP